MLKSPGRKLKASGAFLFYTGLVCNFACPVRCTEQTLYQAPICPPAPKIRYFIKAQKYGNKTQNTSIFYHFLRKNGSIFQFLLCLYYKNRVKCYSLMKNKLVEMIKENQNSENDEEKQDNEIPELTWLVFSLNEDLYAIEASMSKEILRNLDIYPLPFVPSFVKGVVNRHGEPYSVVDLSLFLEKEKQETSLFIVLNLPDSKFCIQITDVMDFHTAPEDSVIKLEEVQDASFYNGTIDYAGKNVPILNAAKIYEKIRVNIENFR